MDWINAAIAAADIALILVVMMVAAGAGWRLADEVRAIARVVKQTYGDSIWSVVETRRGEDGRVTRELGRNIDNRTDGDVALARSGAIALAIIYGLTLAALIGFAGAMIFLLHAPGAGGA